VLFCHHHGHPDIPIRSNGFNDFVQQIPVEALSLVDLDDLLAFQRRSLLAVSVFALTLAFISPFYYTSLYAGSSNVRPTCVLHTPWRLGCNIAVYASLLPL
jgi:hypothetical protein